MPDVEKIARPTIGSLLNGIVEDAKQLGLAHFDLRRYQVQRQATKAKTVAIWTGIGVALTAIGFFLMILMLVHLLYAFFAIALWAGYAIVGIFLLAIGGSFLYGAKKRM
jgi:uncharacterized membrane protein YqjE